jgi:ribosomal protein L11 methyltransferase
VKPTLRQVAILTNDQSEDAVFALIEQVTGVTPGIHTDIQTGLVTVSAFLPLPDSNLTPLRRDLNDGLRRIIDAGLDPAPARVRIRKVPPRDWAESWKRHFKPVAIGRQLLVKPTWNRRKPLPGQALVLLDPGLSFGTGQHATTRFCLAELVRFRAPTRTQSLLDAGSGSGILALGAVALGYSPVEGFDFDPDCVRTAVENTALNGMTGQVDWSVADVTRLPRRVKHRFDVVCANLMHDLLISEADTLTARVKSGGLLVLAGILTTQFPAVEAAYKTLGWKLVRAHTEGEWRSGSFAVG